jgi:REP element-mobilizing transposase RayT
MARGNRKSPIFENDDDRAAFLALLKGLSERYAVRVYGACLMGNHYHVVAGTPRGNLSDAMRFLNGVFAQSSNRRHGRTGHVFEARCRSLVVQQESYLKRVARYVVLNPVRAHLVSHPADWPWSTYRATAGLEPAPTWLWLDWLEWAFRSESRQESLERFARYVNEPAARKSPIDTRALVLGARAFRERVLRAAERGPDPDRPLPMGCRAVTRPALADLLALGSVHWSTAARAAYQAHVTHGYRQAEIARVLGIDASTVSRWMRRLEQRPPTAVERGRPRPAVTV